VHHSSPVVLDVVTSASHLEPEFLFDFESGKNCTPTSAYLTIQFATRDPLPYPVSAGLLTCGANDYPVASGFERQFPDGKRLFVIIDAESRFFDFHDF